MEDEDRLELSIW